MKEVYINKNYSTVDYTEEEFEELAPSYQAIFYGLTKKEVKDITNGIGLLEKLNALTPEYIGKENRKKAILLGLYGRKLGFSLIESLNNMMIVRNKVSLHTDAGKILVFKSGRCEYLITGFDEETQEGWCKSKRKDFSEGYCFKFSISDAEKAFLINSTPSWKKYPKRMCINRATWFVLRDQYADILAGMGNVEEQQDIEYSEKSTWNYQVKGNDPLKDNDLLLEELKKTNITSSKINMPKENVAPYPPDESKIIDSTIPHSHEEHKSETWKKLYGNVGESSFELGIEEERENSND